MTHVRRALPALLATLALGSPAPAAALKRTPGGTLAPAAAAAAAAAGTASGSNARPQVGRPVISLLSVPATASAGAPPQVALRLADPGGGTVYVRVAVVDLATHRAAVSALLGWVRTGRTVHVRWPTGASLAAGAYRVSVAAHDHHGGQLLRGAHSSGGASLTVTTVAPPSAPAAQPQAPARQTAAPAEAGVPTPAQTAALGAVFPVAGPHEFGGPENRFGAPRGTHIHQGQDVLTAEGTPVLAPLAGTVVWTSYQEGGAGYYAVEHTDVGLDLMFAHCQAASLSHGAGQAIAAGTALCRAGQTGDATTPHLHFEMWVGGWQAAGGHPIDPLPYLEVWEHP